MAHRNSREQIVAYMREAELSSGDKLPAEIELARQLGLSRNSIREAYAELEAQGVLIRRHGIGTFVARTPIINDFGNSRTFWGMIEDAGAMPSLTELVSDQVFADADIGKYMGVDVGTPLHHLRWLFCADNHPVVLIDHYLAPHITIANIAWQQSRNLLAALADQIGGESAELETWNTAINVGEDEALLLELEPGLAVLHGFARVHDAADRVPIVSRHWSNPKLFSVAHRQPISARQLLS